MATPTLLPYKNNTTTQAFALVSESPNGAKYLVSGRPIGLPYTIEIIRKLTAPGAAGNDEVTVITKRVEVNATTGKLATFYEKRTISIPKDQTVLTPTVQKEVLSIGASLYNESTAMEATTTFITALIEGRNP